MDRKYTKEDRDFYFTKSALNIEIIRCKSMVEDLNIESRIEVAKAFLKDSKGKSREISTITGMNIMPILNILEIPLYDNMLSIKSDIADMIINDNFDNIDNIMKGELYRYVARATGTNEKIFYQQEGPI